MNKFEIIADLYQKFADDPSQSIQETLCGSVWDAAIEAAAQKMERMPYLYMEVAADIRTLKAPSVYSYNGSERDPLIRGKGEQ